MCGAHKQVYITHAWLFAASVTNTHAYTSTHTPFVIYNQQNQNQHFYPIKSSWFQL